MGCGVLGDRDDALDDGDEKRREEGGHRRRGILYIDDMLEANTT